MKTKPMEKSSVKLRKDLMSRVAFLNDLIAGHATEDTAKSKLERSLFEEFNHLTVAEKRAKRNELVEQVHKLGY